MFSDISPVCKTFTNNEPSNHQICTQKHFFFNDLDFDRFPFGNYENCATFKKSSILRHLESCKALSCWSSIFCGRLHIYLNAEQLPYIAANCVCQSLLLSFNQCLHYDSMLFMIPNETKMHS